MRDPRSPTIAFAYPLDKVFAREGIAIVRFVRVNFLGIWRIRAPCDDLVNSRRERGAVTANPAFVLLVSSSDFNKGRFFNERILEMVIVSTTFAGSAAEEKLPFVLGFNFLLHLILGIKPRPLAISGRELRIPGTLRAILYSRRTCWLVANHAYTALCAMRAHDFGGIIRRESLPLWCIMRLAFSNSSYDIRAALRRQAVPVVGKGALEAENRSVTDLKTTLKYD